MSINTTISIDQLKRAIIVAEQIEKLEAELSQILGGSASISSSTTTIAPTPAKDPRKGKRSAAVRARMAAAQKARYAKAKAPTAAVIEKIAKIEANAPKAEKPKKKKGGMSTAGRAAIIAAQKKRWAAIKAAKKAKPEVEALQPAPVMKAGPGKSIPLSELKVLIEAAPEKTVNIRKEGLQLRNIKVLATANPSLLKLGGSGPWPTVTILK